jgi:hypothetical protein
MDQSSAAKACKIAKIVVDQDLLAPPLCDGRPGVFQLNEDTRGVRR